MSHSKLSVSHLLETVSSDDFETDDTYYLEDLSWIDHKPGLPIQTLEYWEDIKVLSLKVKNVGDLPSTNIKISLLFKVYGTVNFYPKDANETVTTLFPREVFDKREIDITIPYMGADEEKIFKICSLHGQFRETELNLLSIRANGFSYIKRNAIKEFFFKNDSIIMLNHYKCSYLKSDPLSESDFKNLYGLVDKSDV